MALIAWNIWKINMVGTIQSNQTGALMTASIWGGKKKDININKLWQHNTQSLVATIWSDNSPVKKLSNYHQQEIIHAGMTRRNIGPDGVREKQQKPVDAPMQNAD